MRGVFICALILWACSKAKPESPTADPPAAALAQWHAAEDRLPRFAPDGFVVSLDHGEPRNQGDSLIWTGIAMASVDCAHGAPLEQALIAMGPEFSRHPTLKDKVSLDGALGLYRGIAFRVMRCGATDTWRPFLAEHQANEPYLNHAAGVKLSDPFTVVRDKLLARVGLGSEPNADRQAALEATVAAWAEGVKATHAACYRVHLGLLALQTVEELGGRISTGGRNAFCGATDGLGLPTTDYWCGRGDLAGWVRSFQYDAWQYRHQRCSAWEQSDGNGLEQPAIDLLRGLTDAYAFAY